MPFTQECFVPSFFEMSPLVTDKKNLLCQCNLPYDFEKGTFLKKCDPLHPRMLCARLDRNWLSSSGQEDFLNSLFSYHIPLGKVVAHHLNKCDSPSLKNALC